MKLWLAVQYCYLLHFRGFI